MLAAILTSSGGRVIIPDAVRIIPGDREEEVYFVDEAGRVLVVFQRADLAISVEPDKLVNIDQYGNGHSSPPTL